MTKHTEDPDFNDQMSETASRSGYDSTAEMARGKTKEAAGRLSGDATLEDEGIVQQGLADAEAKEDLKPWRREHDQP